ncbi:hypothetical protein G6011_07513 [Alternaria panax]|uniref:Uncharacterized protein n=1 Tax=Alternaria panax TaxID=48097 RepID=A0AAD4FH07_9PLEO|nr:hypothetical protein G6011_07513 [Alternaria panax]
MKSLLIFTAFISSALASAIQLPPNLLMDRAIDPATMNPTLFSVLSVLKTGMPTGPNVPMPTGGSEPDWYQKLPEDVKSLLPKLYPVEPTAQAVVAAAAAATTTMSEAQGGSQVVSSSVLESGAAVSRTETTVSASAPTSTNAVSASSSIPHLEDASQIPSSTVLPSASATPSSSLSAGARIAVKTETMVLVAFLSVGAGFYIFA